MASAFYNEGRDYLVGPGDWTTGGAGTGDFEVRLIKSSYTYSATHSWGDVSGHVVDGAGTSMDGCVVSAGVLDANDVTVDAGNIADTPATVGGILIKSDNAAGDVLISWHDDYSNLPLDQSGTDDIVIKWDNGANRIGKL